MKEEPMMQRLISRIQSVCADEGPLELSVALMRYSSMFASRRTSSRSAPPSTGFRSAEGTGVAGNFTGHMTNRHPIGLRQSYAGGNLLPVLELPSSSVALESMTESLEPLRIMAHRARLLAAGATDAQARQEFLRIAEKLEAEALAEAPGEPTETPGPGDPENLISDQPRALAFKAPAKKRRRKKAG